MFAINIVKRIVRGKDMKKIVRQIVYSIIVIAFVFCYAHIAKTHNIYDKTIDTSKYKETTSYMDKNVTQQFQSEEMTLDGIRLKCKSKGITDNIQVKFSLIDVDTEDVVAEGVVSGNQFKDSKFYEFNFDTVSECKNKSYKFILEETGNTVDNYIDFCYTDTQEKNTEMEINNEAVVGTLVMKTVTNRFDIETFCVLLIFIVYIVVFLKFLYKLFK